MKNKKLLLLFSLLVSVSPTLSFGASFPMTCDKTGAVINDGNSISISEIGGNSNTYRAYNNTNNNSSKICSNDTIVKYCSNSFAEPLPDYEPNGKNTIYEFELASGGTTEMAFGDYCGSTVQTDLYKKEIEEDLNIQEGYLVADSNGDLIGSNVITYSSTPCVRGDEKWFLELEAGRYLVSYCTNNQLPVVSDTLTNQYNSCNANVQSLFNSIKNGDSAQASYNSCVNEIDSVLSSSNGSSSSYNSSNYTNASAPTTVDKVLSQDVEEKKRKKLLEYAVVLGYDYIPLAKKLNNPSKKIPSQASSVQSLFGAYGDVEYDSMTGIASYDSEEDLGLSTGDVQALAKSILEESMAEYVSYERPYTCNNSCGVVLKKDGVAVDSSKQNISCNAEVSYNMGTGVNLNVVFDSSTCSISKVFYSDNSGNNTSTRNALNPIDIAVGESYSTNGYEFYNSSSAQMNCGSTGSYNPDIKKCVTLPTTTTAPDGTRQNCAFNSCVVGGWYYWNSNNVSGTYLNPNNGNVFGVDADKGFLKFSNRNYEKVMEILENIYTYNKVEKLHNLDASSTSETEQIIANTDTYSGLSGSATIESTSSVATNSTLTSAKSSYGTEAANTLSSNQNLESLRLTNNELAEIVKDAKNGIVKQLEKFKKIIKYDLHPYDLPTFDFLLKSRQNKFDLELPANYIIPKIYYYDSEGYSYWTWGNPTRTCSDGSTTTRYVDLSIGIRVSYCVMNVRAGIVDREVNFRYDPIKEKRKAFKGDSFVNDTEDWNIIDLYDSKYASEHNMTTEAVGSSNQVEGLIGLVETNPDLIACNNAMSSGTAFTFKENRNPSDGSIIANSTNFLNDYITVYSHSIDSVISDRIDIEKSNVTQTYLMDGYLSKLEQYIDSDTYNALVSSLKSQVNALLDTQDIIDIIIKSDYLKNSLTPEELYHVIAIVSNSNSSDELPQTSSITATEKLIWKTKEDIELVLADNEVKDSAGTGTGKINSYTNDIFLNTKTKKMYLKAYKEGLTDLTFITTPELLEANSEQIEITFSSSTALLTLLSDINFGVNNLSTKGVYITKNGSAITFEELATILERTYIIGLVPSSLTSGLILSKEIDFGLNDILNTISLQAANETELVCQNAIYFDYNIDNLIREKLKAFDKLSEYFLYYGEPNVPSNVSSSSIYAQASTLGITSRTSAWDADKCDKIKWTWKGPKCTPGTSKRLKDLFYKNGKDITGAKIKNYINSVANGLAETKPLLQSQTVSVNGQNVTIPSINSSIFNAIFNSTVIHQYYPKYKSSYKDDDSSGFPICLNCSSMNYKPRSQVVNDINYVFRQLKTKFHNTISALININAYDKCRNDLHTYGEAKIERRYFNPKFISTNPKNVSPIKLEDSNGTVNFATTYSHPTQNNTEVSIRVTNLTNPLSANAYSICGNLITATKFQRTGTAEIPLTFNKIPEFKRATGLFLSPKTYPGNPYKEKYGNPNIFQSLICSSKKIETNQSRLTTNISSNTGSVICQSPLLNIHDASMKLLSVGYAKLLDGKYNALTAPYKMVVLKFIDVKDMLTDNEIGVNKTLSGSEELTSEIISIGDYDTMNKIEQAQNECLKFKSEIAYSTGFDFDTGAEKSYKIYPNKDKRYSYKAKVCTADDTASPKRWVKGQYCETTGCNSCATDDTIFVVQDCSDIMNHDKYEGKVYNFTCEDAGNTLKTLGKQKATSQNLNELGQEATTEMSNYSRDTQSKLEQGVSKNIDEDGKITMEYTREASGIKQLSMSDSFAEKQSNVGASEMSNVYSKNVNGTNAVSEMGLADSGATDNFNTSTKEMDTTTDKNKVNSIQTAKGGYSVTSTDTDNSKNYSKRMLGYTGGDKTVDYSARQDTPSQKYKSWGNEKTTTVSAVEDQAKLECPDCGNEGYSKVTLEQVDDYLSTKVRGSEISDADTKTMLNGLSPDETKGKTLFEEVPNDTDFQNSTNTTSQNYNRYRAEESITPDASGTYPEYTYLGEYQKQNNTLVEMSGLKNANPDQFLNNSNITENREKALDDKVIDIVDKNRFSQE